MKRIPGSTAILENISNRNPSGRLTRPEDIADVVYLLSRPEAEWITGAIIKVDGGESLC
jgi:enoyl-[acyl-carrier protein] reductase I